MTRVRHLKKNSRIDCNDDTMIIVAVVFFFVFVLCTFVVGIKRKIKSKNDEKVEGRAGLVECATGCNACNGMDRRVRPKGRTEDAHGVVLAPRGHN